LYFSSSWSMQSSLLKGKLGSGIHSPNFDGGSAKGLDLTLRAGRFPHYQLAGLLGCVRSIVWFKGLFIWTSFKSMITWLGAQWLIPPILPGPSKSEQKQTSCNWSRYAISEFPWG
jgi:hypothetical protein